MKRNVFVLGILFALFAGACAPQAAPTANSADVQHTAEAAAFTMVAQTQGARPSPTPIPPTAIASSTSAATNTPPPLPTLSTPGTQVTQITQAVSPPTGLPTFTAQPPPSNSGSNNNQDICNQPLTSWQGPTANFTIANQTRPQGTIVLSMYVVTEFNQCGYLIITGDSFTGPVGQYTAGAFITGRQNFKAFGGFRITEGNWKIIVKNDSIEARGGCYPDC